MDEKPTPASRSAICPMAPQASFPRSFWRFGRIEDDGSYVPDPNYICAERKFEKGRLYQLVHTTIGRAGPRSQLRRI